MHPKIDLREPEELYPDEPGRAISQTVAWGHDVNRRGWSRGEITLFTTSEVEAEASGEPHRWLVSHTHVPEESEFSTFVSGGYIAIRFGRDVRVWIKQERIGELITALLSEPAKSRHA